MVPSREIFWNIQFGELIYIPAVIVVGFLIYALYRRYRLWRVGRPDNRPGAPLGKRIWAFIVTVVIDGILHRKFFGVAENPGHRRFHIGDFIPRELYPGIAHFLIFIGLIILLIGTALDVISYYAVDFLHGTTYLGYSVITDIGGIVAIIGVILAMVRRYGQRPDRLDNKPDNLIVLSLILVVVVTGYIVEGLRITATEIKSGPGWAPWSPGGYIVALTFNGLSQRALLNLHVIWWWLHAFISLGAIAYVALYFSQLWHIIIGPLNVFFRNLGPRGALTLVDIEEADTFGASKIEDFTWKHLMDLDACTRCGRCQDNCPVYLSSKSLSPKKVIQDLKRHFLERAPILLRNKENGMVNNSVSPARTMIGEVISEGEIWACTTCGACLEVCPVWVEPVTKIIEMRRNLVFESKLDCGHERVLHRTLDEYNPWGLPWSARDQWATGLDVEIAQEGKQYDFLYWVGCAAYYDDRVRQIARSLITIFKQAGLRVAILGNKEMCCGDMARRVGDEGLFQKLALANIQTIERIQATAVVTHCPHGFHTMKDEYPQLGANFQVFHHTQVLKELMLQGKLAIRQGRNERIVYHDPCYLGRYQQVFDEPRILLKNIAGAEVLEMKRTRERSCCCGAGGGSMWLDELENAERISSARVDEALQTGATTIVTSCPFCLTMLADTPQLRTRNDVQVVDVVELINKASR